MPVDGKLNACSMIVVIIDKLHVEICVRMCYHVSNKVGKELI